MIVYSKMHKKPTSSITDLEEYPYMLPTRGKNIKIKNSPSKLEIEG